MRKFVVAALLAAGVAALASAALGSTKSPARVSSAGSALVTCGKTRTIGLAAPITGPAAAIGNQQVRWAKYYVKRWNAQKANKNKQIKVISGDTQLGVDTAFAVKVAKSFASNSKLLGVVGPAGSQEVVASTSSYKRAGLGYVSGSATRTTLTDGHTDGNRRGYFFRTVPNDGAQAPVVANWMTKKLKWKRVYIIDDQETYSQGLADGVQKILARPRRQGHPRLDQPERLGLLVQDREDPEQHPGDLHPVAARAAGSDLRPAAQGRGQGQDQAVRLGRPVRPGCLEDRRLVRLGLPVQPD